MRGDKTRQEILEAACELFIQNGFHATTTRQITEKINLVPGALYNHFSSKDVLFEAVLKEYHPWQKIPEALKEAKGSTIQEYIRDASAKLLKIWDQHPELIRLHLIDMLEFNGKHLPVLFEETYTKISKIVEEAQSHEDGLKGVNMNLLYRAIVGLFFGYIMSDKAMVDIDSPFSEGGFDYFADTYLLGLFAQGNPKIAKEELGKS
ncbi:MAG: TetR/AcrR family transcriptional regulator [Anaerolineae bacterium]|jgi:AcrR family transcriptional regulator|nr:TetR/AcrR family transcriptional regulator [Anaerolineae bacterium]